MKRIMKITLTTALISFVFYTIYIIILASNMILPWQQNDAIKATIDMGGLSTLPDDIENLKIEKKGSMFTRQFIIQFNSTDNKIQEWIDASKRLKNNAPKILNRTRIYDIYPGEGGAMGGQVKIRENFVVIDMSWS